MSQLATRVDFTTLKGRVITPTLNSLCVKSIIQYLPMGAAQRHNQSRPMDLCLPSTVNRCIISSQKKSHLHFLDYYQPIHLPPFSPDPAVVMCSTSFPVSHSLYNSSPLRNSMHTHLRCGVM